MIFLVISRTVKPRESQNGTARRQPWFLGHVNLTKVVFRPIYCLKLIFLRGTQNLFSGFEREFNSRHYSILHCLL